MKVYKPPDALQSIRDYLSAAKAIHEEIMGACDAGRLTQLREHCKSTLFVAGEALKNRLGKNVRRRK